MDMDTDMAMDADVDMGVEVNLDMDVWIAWWRESAQFTFPRSPPPPSSPS